MMGSEDSRKSWYWTRQIRRRGVLWSGVAGGAALALAACRASTKSASSPSGSQPSSAAGKPRSGGTLNMAITADPYNWDPSYAGAGGAASYGYHLAYNTVL